MKYFIQRTYMKYINHFAENSSEYLKFRPTYPRELFDYLIKITKKHGTAWDCGTGNGQAAIELAKKFHHVIATDISQEQLDQAAKFKNIEYHAWPAEKTKIPNHSVDLITVAQALHWFDLKRFYREVVRVANTNAVIAAWCYSLGNITPEVDVIVKKLHFDILGNAYWPKERKYIDEKYETIPFPFEKKSTPQFYIEKSMSLGQFIGYLKTWSAIKEYEKRNNCDLIQLILADLKDAWGGNPETKHVMRWPIHLLVGTINKKT